MANSERMVSEVDRANMHRLTDPSRLRMLASSIRREGAGHFGWVTIAVVLEACADRIEHKTVREHFLHIGRLQLPVKLRLLEAARVAGIDVLELWDMSYVTFCERVVATMTRDPK
jgi:hypothetical protein